MTARQSLLRDQLLVLLETEPVYTVTHVPCQFVGHRRRPLELEEWRRKICQWSFRVVDHLRKYVLCQR